MDIGKLKEETDLFFVTPPSLVGIGEWVTSDNYSRKMV
jgi:hypothetical protein